MGSPNAIAVDETILGYRRVLLVEDEAIIAMAESAMLERGGYEVVRASTGEEAVAIARSARGCDLALMDIDLGRGMDGTRAAEAILLERDLPIVFMSSHTEPELVHRTDRISSYGYILKSSAPTVVFASLRTAVRLHEAKRALEARERQLEEAASEYRWLLESMINAFVIWDSVFDDEGRYVDFRFGYFNEAYSRISGLTLEEVRGKRVYAEVWPGTEPHWLEIYGRVALSGLPETFERFHAPTGRRYLCRAYRPWPSTDRICVVFEEAREA